ncbi:MAG: YihY/virulence factor BrkB family protein [Verrucomicrobiota bacterium]
MLNATAKFFSTCWQLLYQTIVEFLEDKATAHAAALAFYTIFSLAPMLLIAMVTAALFFGEAEARQQIVQFIDTLLGQQSSETINLIVNNTLTYIASARGSAVAMTIAVAASIIGATAVFAQLQDSLNTVWHVRPKPGGNLRSAWMWVRVRLMSFLVIVGIGLLLIFSLLARTAFNLMGEVMEAVRVQLEEVRASMNEQLPDHTALPSLPEIPEMPFTGGLDLVMIFLTVVLGFAMMFKILPDVIIRWRDVWIGASVSAGLFVVGVWFIDYYLTRSNIGIVYGTAGSLALILVWIYYSALIFLFGAEFTAVYARYRGRNILPNARAQRFQLSYGERGENRRRRAALHIGRDVSKSRRPRAS